LNRRSNIELLNRVKEPFDFLILGGGATGLGCALDASSRGYSVLLLEKYDFCKGTSSRSTKLIHGGVRYLEKGQLSLVYQALKERDILIKNAPHLVNQVGFLIPTYNYFRKIYYWIGLTLYDFISGNKIFKKSKMIGFKKALSLVPNINKEKLKGGVVYYDGQFNDSRMGIDIALTATNNNAILINYMPVESLIKTNNRVVGVKAKDSLFDKEYEIQAKNIINCTGVFSQSVMNMDSSESKSLITASQGVHLVVDKKFLSGGFGILVPKTSDSRVLFAVPWLGEVLLGTTDTELEKPTIDPIPTEKEIEFIIDNVKKYMNIKPSKKDIKSVFVGLRALVGTNKNIKSKDISRDHKIIVSDSGLISVIGGKWTNYRIMGKEVVDKAIKASNIKFVESQTENLKIKNGLDNIGIDEKSLSSIFYISKSQIQHYLREEMAINLDDIMSRRSRCLFLNSKESIAIAPKVVEIMANELSKDKDWIENQLNQFYKLTKLYSI
jgi:glycerol-3-phosphate dehydrogenase